MPIDRTLAIDRTAWLSIDNIGNQWNRRAINRTEWLSIEQNSINKTE